MKPQLWIEHSSEETDTPAGLSRYSSGMRALADERARRSIHDRCITPVVGRRLAWHKPANGGLWTSTFGETDGWIDFMDSEQHYFDQDPEQWRWWLLIPRPQARIYTVDDRDDLIKLVNAYPGTSSVRNGHEARLTKTLDLFGRFPDWEAVSKDYDGVHLTSRGQGATRSPIEGAPNLSGWDCESTLWFRWAFSAIVQTSQGTVYEALGRAPFSSPDEW